jgi:tetratricopeptide (TPR) repeat protein
MHAHVYKFAPPACVALVSLALCSRGASSELAVSTDRLAAPPPAVVVVQGASPLRSAAGRRPAPSAPAPALVLRQPESQVRLASFTEPPPEESPATEQSATAHGWLIAAHRLSLSAVAESQFAEIVRLCTEALAQTLDPESTQFARELAAWALNRRGQLRAEEGQEELALADFEAAVAHQPDHWRALHNRGVTLAHQGEFARAFDDFTRVIELRPEFPKSYANRATLYAQAGDGERAMADYDHALARDAKLTAAHLGCGRVCHSLGRLPKAVEHLQAASRLAPDDAETLCALADALADMGRYEEALRNYARSIQLAPSLAQAYRNGSWLLATCPDERFRDPPNAIRGAEQAIELSYGQRHLALDALAAALASAGRFAEALATVQQAIDIAPEEARSALQARQQLYESRQPFISPPADAVQTAGYAE